LSGGVDFTRVPAALHHPAALWEAGGILVSALVDERFDWRGLYMRLGVCQERQISY
jgi:hypothetical protein